MRYFFAILILLFSNDAFTQSKYSWIPAFPDLPFFFFPTEIVNAGDNSNRFFVTEQAGRIYVFENDKQVSQRKLFLDISDKVYFSGSFGDENGLLGLAFHPSYSSNGYFYVNYTHIVNSVSESVISRYQVSPTNPDSALKSSELIILTQTQPFGNHNGGCIRFGSDGFLYVSLGDGGGVGDPFSNGQNIFSLLGKILRIDVDLTSGNLNYGIPVSNPFADSTNPNVKKEIYGYGFRNVWKFSFDNFNDSLWAADVGEQRIEEINIVRSGGNYGWRCYEGTLPFNTKGCDSLSQYIFPVFEYGHDQGQSITGGYVYRGNKFPELYGKYIYGDYISRRTWALEWDGVTANNFQLTHETYFISAFAEDENKELYLMRYTAQQGQIYKLDGPVSISNSIVELPDEFILYQNYPNPFNPVTTIKFSLPQKEFVEIKIYDLLGKEVKTLLSEEKPAGIYSITFNAERLSSGMYFYQLKAEEFSQTRKLILLR